MISRMTLAEKIGSLGSSKNAIPSLGLPSYSWRSEAEHGIEYARFDKLTPYATDFAFPTTLAMSFNKSLFRAIGAQVGAEVRRSVCWLTVVVMTHRTIVGFGLISAGCNPCLCPHLGACAYECGKRRLHFLDSSYQPRQVHKCIPIILPTRLIYVH